MVCDDSMPLLRCWPPTGYRSVLLKVTFSLLQYARFLYCFDCFVLIYWSFSWQFLWLLQAVFGRKWLCGGKHWALCWWCRLFQGNPVQARFWPVVEQHDSGLWMYRGQAVGDRVDWEETIIMPFYKFGLHVICLLVWFFSGKKLYVYVGQDW